MQPTTPIKPVLLVELLDLATEEIHETDVTIHLANALEAVYVHLADYPETVTPQVSVAKDGELEGIAFLGPKEQQLAFITAYYLDRDTLSCEFEALRALAALPLQELDAGLKALFC